MSVDFCQIELRVLAHLSKDSTLLAALNAPGDVFINLSSKWHKIPENEVCIKELFRMKYGVQVFPNILLGV